jgi:hypothetical protein
VRRNDINFICIPNSRVVYRQDTDYFSRRQVKNRRDSLRHSIKLSQATWGRETALENGKPNRTYHRVKHVFKSLNGDLDRLLFDVKPFAEPQGLSKQD